MTSTTRIHKLIIFIILPTVLFVTDSFGQPANEEVIRKYLNNEVDFGEFQLLNHTNERLTKEEYEFRKRFRTTYMHFINDLGNSNGIKTALEQEELTDIVIAETYLDMFEQFEGMTFSELSEFAVKAKMEPKRFESTLKEVQRFNKNWNNEKGKYQRSTWFVNSDGDSMVLYFYLDEQNTVIEYQQDFTDI